MKSSTRKTYTKVHTWTGLVSGLFLFIAFYAGSITVFKHELEEWDDYTTDTPVFQDYEQAQSLVDAVLKEDKHAAENFRLYPSEEDHHGNLVYHFDRKENGELETHAYKMNEDAVLIKFDRTAHLADFVYRLHYTAGITPRRVGLYILGVISLIYGLAIVTGILIFIPNFLKDLFIIRPPKNNKRFWLDAHNVAGVISLPWHFMFAWSSAILAIGIFFLAPFQFLVFEDDLIQILGPELGVVQTPEASGEPAQMLSVKEIVEIAKASLPSIQPNRIIYEHAGDANGTARIFGDLGKGTLDPRGSITISSVTGDILNIHDPSTATPGSSFYRGLVSLHFVSYGGYSAKWVNFFLGLAGAFLFYSGNLLWIESRRKRKKIEQRKDTRFLAKLNSGVCMGCMAGISAAFIASRLAIDLTDRPEYTEYAYYGVFFASIAWAFARPVAAGAKELLYLCAALTASIPLIDAIITDMTFWQSLQSGEWSMATINLMALMGALGFWLMARAVLKRSQNGDPNSIWASNNGIDESQNQQTKAITQ